MKGKTASRKPGAIVLGWREWLALPDIGVRMLKAKLDTGARTSSLHAFRMRLYLSDGQEMVRFEVHPVQRSSAAAVVVEAPVLEERRVRNSGGRVEVRPVIETTLELAGARWPIELTLTQRDEMGFRMLLGRQALRGRVIVNPGASFRAGRGGSRSNDTRRVGRPLWKPRDQEEEE